MKLFNAYKFKLSILDEKYHDSEELIDLIANAVYDVCRVRCVEVELTEEKENVISTVDCELGEA